MKKHRSTIFFILIFFVGLSVVLYPAARNALTRQQQAAALKAYQQAADALTEAEDAAALAQAEDYNQRLADAMPGAFLEPGAVEGYDDVLNTAGDGIMGRISIPKLHIDLPICHGTDAEALETNIGHLEGTSLPVGGAGTHAVLSGHRGLPSAKLFSNLDKLEKGDTFTITVLDRVLTYEVDQISTVLPNETDLLRPVAGQDYVTLMTCTPYGINTHRLLVRGRRIDTPDAQKQVRVRADAAQLSPVRAALWVVLPLAVVLAAVLLWHRRKNHRPENTARGDH